MVAVSTRSARRWERATAVLLAVTGASAVYGAIGLVAALPGFDLPVEDLAVLGLTSWTLPGLALLLIIALPMLGTAWALVHAKPHAVALARGCGAVLLSWLALEMLIIGFTAPAQYVTLALALAICTAASLAQPVP